MYTEQENRELGHAGGLLTVDAAATRMKVHRAAMWRFIRRYPQMAVQIGRHWWVKTSALNNLSLTAEIDAP